MRTSVNVWVQVGALVVFLGLRVSTPGWMLVFLVVTGLPLVFALTPLITALVVRKRRVLPRPVAAPFVAAAVTLVLAGALVADFGDTDEVRVPILVGQVFHYDDPLSSALNTAGFGCVALYVVSVVWMLVAVIPRRKA